LANRWRRAPSACQSICAEISFAGPTEYVEWIAEARREATRSRRIAQALEWLVDGKSRNWKYEAC
jgi:uncharacterized protein YdeI (YjbR/CyaY-like superfamily)